MLSNEDLFDGSDRAAYRLRETIKKSLASAQEKAGLQILAKSKAPGLMAQAEKAMAAGDFIGALAVYEGRLDHSMLSDAKLQATCTERVSDLLAILWRFSRVFSRSFAHSSLNFAHSSLVLGAGERLQGRH